MDAKVHVFEKAGLGKAPFRFVGFFEDRGPKEIQAENGVTITCGSPGQPMGTCAYCGTGIAECCEIQSADGKRFIVGNQCVEKTGDKGLVKAIKPHIREARLRARHKREASRIEAGEKLLADAAVREILSGQPHPYLYMAKDGYTALEFCDWMLEYAGNSGKIKACRLLEKTAKNITAAA